MQRIKAILLTVSFLGLGQLSAQTFDYLSVRDSTALFTCVKVDSATIAESFKRLHAIDSNAIDTNLNIYLDDLADVYWMYAVLKKDKKWNWESLAIYKRLVQLQPENWSAWKSLADQYAFLDNCVDARMAWEKYRELAPQEILTSEAGSTSTFAHKCE